MSSKDSLKHETNIAVGSISKGGTVGFEVLLQRSENSMVHEFKSYYSAVVTSSEDVLAYSVDVSNFKSLLSISAY